MPSPSQQPWTSSAISLLGPGVWVLGLSRPCVHSLMTFDTEDTSKSVGEASGLHIPPSTSNPCNGKPKSEWQGAKQNQVLVDVERGNLGLCVPLLTGSPPGPGIPGTPLGPGLPWKTQEHGVPRSPSYFHGISGQVMEAHIALCS